MLLAHRAPRTRWAILRDAGRIRMRRAARKRTARRPRSSWGSIIIQPRRPRLANITRLSELLPRNELGILVASHDQSSSGLHHQGSKTAAAWGQRNRP